MTNGWLRQATTASVLVAVCVTSTASVLRAQRPEPGFRALAPGVETTIAPHIEPGETVSTRDIAEVLSQQALERTPFFGAPSRTLYGMAKQAKIRRTAWCLEFSFKPLRMIEVDLPTADGVWQRRLVWYLVYRVTNTGEHLASLPQDNGTYRAEAATAEQIRFVPRFLLEAHDRGFDDSRVYKAYPDVILPAAVGPIEARERTGNVLLTTDQMAQQLVPARQGSGNESLYGVATWVDIDPHVDYFSVFVGGLSNAYRWVDPTDGTVADNGDSLFARKYLQLNFWRPGDAFRQHESEIRFGVPTGKAALYGVPDGVAHQWIYR